MNVIHLCVKMADEVNGTKCAVSFVNNISSSDIPKCAELEVQLQRTLDELSSAQLIIQM
jgi:hypothetical protein